MKRLEIKQMENVQGGLECDRYQNRVMAVAGAAATVLGFFGPIGAMIAGPTAVGAAVYGIYCAFKE
ncbi:hypothetical protein CGC48_06495 [Capnocytophaga cynodegmi]|uniref:Bacteriocin n=1 Tax=Capnocytophaga cynodegmi TaxID=28189 RepID=A0A250E9A5_9FLAO|nr:hypothetical protein [Capnocytophaga cynodegmi]ATA68307.1 hypothetical protein CGC48_06495 [Capnocytophaga cynodegmi]